jgi:2-phosphosulfolactate phosphatase
MPVFPERLAARSWREAVMGGMDVRFVGVGELGDAPSVAVVVDVMRAFTVAPWCFARGAEKIVLAESLDEALARTARHLDWVALKDGPPAPGFELVNSPGQLRSVDLAGRTVVQKTTAGTVGALAVKDASLVLCASFVVATATARVLRGCDSVTFVVTGEDGQAEEDLACARYIARAVTEPGVDAAEYVRRAASSRAATELAAGVRADRMPTTWRPAWRSTASRSPCRPAGTAHRWCSARTRCPDGRLTADGTPQVTAGRRWDSQVVRVRT